MRLVIGGLLALTGWFLILVVVTALAPPTTRVVVIAGSSADAFAATVAAGGYPLSPATGGFIAESDGQAAFVRRLYAAGALLVLPVRPGGCGTGAGFGPSSQRAS